MKNVEATLKQAGLDFRHVVMSHVFLDKYENLDVANKVYKEFFEDGSEPACATVFVDWIPGRVARRDHLHRHDRPGRPQGRPSGRPEGPSDAEGPSAAARPSGRGIPCTSRRSTAPGPQGGVAAGNLAEQVHQMARNHTAVLEAAGLTLEDIASGCVYLRDMKDYDPMNADLPPVFLPRASPSGPA